MIPAFRAALERLDRPAAEEIFTQALSRHTPIQAVESLIVPALEQLGAEWEKGEAALSQVYMGGRFCEWMVDRCLPPSDPDRKHQPRSAIVTLSDHHELGKRIVYSMLRASGFEVYDYGCMEVEELVERVCRDRLHALLISTLMLTSALRVTEVCRVLRERRPELRIQVGGAPFGFDPELWREVGADAMGRNAGEAVTWLQRMMQERP